MHTVPWEQGLSAGTCCHAKGAEPRWAQRAFGSEVRLVVSETLLDIAKYSLQTKMSSEKKKISGSLHPVGMLRGTRGGRGVPAAPQCSHDALGQSRSLNTAVAMQVFCVKVCARGLLFQVLLNE